MYRGFSKARYVVLFQKRTSLCRLGKVEYSLSSSSLFACLHGCGPLCLWANMFNLWQPGLLGEEWNKTHGPKQKHTFRPRMDISKERTLVMPLLPVLRFSKFFFISEDISYSFDVYISQYYTVPLLKIYGCVLAQIGYMVVRSYFGRVLKETWSKMVFWSAEHEEEEDS